MKRSYLCLKTPTIPHHPKSFARNWIGCTHNCFVNAFLIFYFSANWKLHYVRGSHCCM